MTEGRYVCGKCGQDPVDGEDGHDGKPCSWKGCDGNMRFEHRDEWDWRYDATDVLGYPL